MSNETKNLFKKKQSTNLCTSDLGNLTLNEIQNSSDELYMKKDTIAVARTSNGKRFTVKQVDVTDGSISTLSAIDCLDLKKDYTQTIMQMKKNGMSAKDISFTLGIHISYVYKLLKKSK